MAHPLEVILPAIVAAIIVIAVAVAATLALRRTTISIIIRKDPDMDTIKQRLATLEASLAALTATVSNHGSQIVDNPATGDQVTAVSDRLDTLRAAVDGIAAEIGTDPTSEVAPAPTPVDPNSPTVFDPSAPTP